MTSSGTIANIDNLAVYIGALKLKYRSIEQVRGLQRGDIVEYEANDKGWLDSIRKIEGGDITSYPSAMTPEKPQDEHTAAGVNGGTVSSGKTHTSSTPSKSGTHSQSHADQEDQDCTKCQHEPGLSPHDTPVQIILHRYEGNESRPDSLTFGESTKYPGLKIYFSAQKPEEFPDILDNSFLLYSLAMDKMRSFREANPDLTNGTKGVKS